MGNTYAMVNERKKEWLRQWAKIMLIVEQSVSRRERLSQQSKYSKKMSDGSRVLITRLIQSVIDPSAPLFSSSIISSVQTDERENIEKLGNIFYDQLRRHLEPEIGSVHSKTKSLANASIHTNNMNKMSKQELFRNARQKDSFSSFDITPLI